MDPALDCPAELWLLVLSFLPRADRLRVRGTCRFFQRLLDSCAPLWRDFSVVLRDFPRYNQRFWRSLARRHTGRVSVRRGRNKNLRQLRTWLPHVHALRLDSWDERRVDELRGFERLRHLSLTLGGACPLDSLDFLPHLSARLTALTVCHVRLTCPPAALLDAVAHLTRLTSLTLHHDGSQRFPPPGGVIAHLPELRHLSWSMIQDKTLSEDFFSPGPLAEGGGDVKLTHLQLVDYDAMVTQDVLRALTRLRSLSVYHMYSVPGPTCHLQTWLTSLPHLHSLHVAGGHNLSAYADLLPATLLSLSLEVDMQPDDLKLVSQRVPQLQHLHLEPWGSPSLVRLVPRLFPGLTSLRVRQRDASDDDVLQLQTLQNLRTLEVIESFCAQSSDQTGPAQKISQLQQLVQGKFRVVTRPESDLLTCNCLTPS